MKSLLRKLILSILVASQVFPTAAALAQTTYTDRFTGSVVATVGKQPVVVATTGPITLLYSQTIDGVLVSDHKTEGTGQAADRVLVKNQVDQTANGIYVVNNTGAWYRAQDFTGPSGVVKGQLIMVNGGTQAGFWSLTTIDPIHIAQTGGFSSIPSNITFAVTPFLNLSFNLGTSLAGTNPHISGDLTSGIYTAGTAKVDIGISGVKIVEWSATGEALTGNLAVSGNQTIGGTLNVTGQITGNVTGTATNATNVATTAVSNSATYYPVFVASSSNSNQPIDLGTGLTFNPSTNVLTTTGFVGALTGNASTATALQNARLIYGNSFDGTANLTQVIASAFGGTNNGFFAVSGPASSTKTFTFPNASANVLTDNAAVTVAQGGTGIQSGTSGGVPYFSTTTSIASSALLASNGLVLGGGAATAPKTAAGLTTDGTSKLTLGVAGSSVGAVVFNNATSGAITMQPVTGALGTVTLSLPAATDTLMGKATTDTMTNKTYDTAGTGNVFKINGTSITSISGNTAKVATASGTLTNTHCVSIDASGNFVDAGASCGTGGGVNAGTAGHVAYYATTSSTVSDGGTPATFGASLVYLATQTVSGSSVTSVDFTAIPAGYDTCKAELTNVVPISNSVLQMQIGEGAGPTYTTSGYRWQGAQNTLSGAGWNGSTSDTSWSLTAAAGINTANLGVSGTVSFSALTTSGTTKTFQSIVYYTNTTPDDLTSMNSGRYTADTNVGTAIRYKQSTGNIAIGSKISMYCLRNQ